MRALAHSFENVKNRVQSFLKMSGEYEWTYWVVEKIGGSVLVCIAFCILRGCWRAARANQRIALGDVYDCGDKREKRGLLVSASGGLPVRSVH